MKSPIYLNILADKHENAPVLSIGIFPNCLVLSINRENTVYKFEQFKEIVDKLKIYNSNKKIEWIEGFIIDNRPDLEQYIKNNNNNNQLSLF